MSKLSLAFILVAYLTLVLIMLSYALLDGKNLTLIIDVLIFISISALFVGILLSYFYITEFGITHRLTKDGISRRRFRFKETFIRWDEIESIGCNSILAFFTITGPKNKIIVSTSLNGLKDFADAVKGNLPFEKWEKIKEHLDYASRGI